MLYMYSGEILIPCWLYGLQVLAPSNLSFDFFMVIFDKEKFLI